MVMSCSSPLLTSLAMFEGGDGSEAHCSARSHLEFDAMPFLYIFTILAHIPHIPYVPALNHSTTVVACLFPPCTCSPPVLAIQR